MSWKYSKHTSMIDFRFDFKSSTPALFSEATWFAQLLSGPLFFDGMGQFKPGTPQFHQASGHLGFFFGWWLAQWSHSIPFIWIMSGSSSSISPQKFYIWIISDSTSSFFAPVQWASPGLRVGRYIPGGCGANRQRRGEWAGDRGGSSVVQMMPW